MLAVTQNRLMNKACSSDITFIACQLTQMPTRTLVEMLTNIDMRPVTSQHVDVVPKTPLSNTQDKKNPTTQRNSTIQKGYKEKAMAHMLTSWGSCCRHCCCCCYLGAGLRAASRPGRCTLGKSRAHKSSQSSHLLLLLAALLLEQELDGQLLLLLGVQLGKSLLLLKALQNLLQLQLPTGQGEDSWL